MLGIIADLLAGCITILFPVFASYKALKASDPAQLAPWCIYWVVLSLFLLFESWTVFILGWLPFYSWIRLCVLSYLVLPQTQGAKLLYFEYISPFIERHEQDIETFIADSHEKAAAAGLRYLKKLIELFREKVLGLPSPQEEQLSPPPQRSYTSDLLSRFSIPSARAPGAPSASDIYSFLGSAITSATATRSLGSIDHPTGSSTAEKLSYLASQRERLTQLLSTVDREQTTLTRENAIEADIDTRMKDLNTTSITNGEGLADKNRSKSAHSFENIDKDDLPSNIDKENNLEETSDAQTPKKRSTSGSWLPSSWWTGSGYPAEKKGNDQESNTRVQEEPTKGQTTGYDPST